MGRTFGGLAAIGGVALLVAGCAGARSIGAASATGSATRATSTAGSAASTGSASTGSGSAGAGIAVSSDRGAGTGTPAQQAATAARALLGDFVPPPGAARYPRPPASVHGQLNAVGGFVSGAMVQYTSWWLASGPDDVILYEKAHLPAGFQSSFTSSGGPVLTQAFELLPDKAPLTSQYLLVSTAPADGGTTAVRVDADVAYQPVRPASERVPATATKVTITLRQVFGPGSGRAPAPVTVSRPAIVRQLVALVDGLPLSTAPTDAPCTSGPPDRVDLAFTTGAGQVVAEAQGPHECDEVSFTINGVSQPALSASGTFVPQVLRLAGLRPVS